MRPLGREAASLIGYMGLSLSRDRARPETVAQWMPLLLDALSGGGAAPGARLAGLLAALEAEPFAPWTAAGMAARAGLSVSRLHALFRAELDSTPRAWLAGLRLGRVREWLAGSRLSIAEIAHRGGYADQSALTRAMRRATGLTPAAYRRQAQESGPKPREG
ncbi:helix-turn-helix transcriptional regulator [Pseudoroseomonas cervicalis]|uniref:helix-turn-helix transcriptional regulator n=1 Tax=Teichococcus cervicalis TaxID=204525 RepID=UPI00278A160D|nr:AraC family transcriptional regulator [Pseudoroseomonas cervicalis]MDQ1077619.1 transcriptional regulator GlxA family with amidase domain [Pseudoroseomonas cervicalis]